MKQAGQENLHWNDRQALRRPAGNRVKIQLHPGVPSRKRVHGLLRQSYKSSEFSGCLWPLSRENKTPPHQNNTTGLQEIEGIFPESRRGGNRKHRDSTTAVDRIDLRSRVEGSQRVKKRTKKINFQSGTSGRVRMKGRKVETEMRESA